MRICSLLPSATEIACALGLEDDLVAVTHECDYPAAVLDKPRITSSAIDHTGSTSAEIHRHISAAVHRGSSIYHLDRELLERLAPDLVLTQELCAVCAVSYEQVERAVRIARSEAAIVSLEPATLEEILETVLRVGQLTDRQAQAERVVAGLRERIDRVAGALALVAVEARPRVLCVEWLDPVFVGGHWVPGMVEAAGGFDGLGRPGEPSFVVTWRQVEEVCAGGRGADALRLPPAGGRRRVSPHASPGRVASTPRGAVRASLRRRRIELLQPAGAAYRRWAGGAWPRCSTRTSRRPCTAPTPSAASTPSVRPRLRL